MQAPAMIREKLEGGILPSEAMASMLVGGGQGCVCDGCEAAILASQVEYEVQVRGRVLRFHRACAALWEVERRRASRAG